LRICAWIDASRMDAITILQAETLRTLASPVRLELLHRLSEGPREVRRLAADLGISQPNVSQHLAVLRSAGIVEVERDGREARYRLVDPDVMVACALMRRVLERRIERLAGLAALGGSPMSRDGMPSPHRADVEPARPQSEVLR
jgi:DNA-binding transcriptional ArsR family regulator